nr:uncharacterized protein LOC112732619 [Arachis hypogaea]
MVWLFAKTAPFWAKKKKKRKVATEQPTNPANPKSPLLALTLFSSLSYLLRVSSSTVHPSPPSVPDPLLPFTVRRSPNHCSLTLALSFSSTHSHSLTLSLPDLHRRTQIRGVQPSAQHSNTNVSHAFVGRCGAQHSNAPTPVSATQLSLLHSAISAFRDKNTKCLKQMMFRMKMVKMMMLMPWKMKILEDFRFRLLLY